MARKRVVKHKKNETKRNFSKIRRTLLKDLYSSPKNLNELSKSSKVNWRTTRNHMVYFVGKGYAQEIFSSPQVRIFKITQMGMEVLARNEI